METGLKTFEAHFQRFARSYELRCWTLLLVSRILRHCRAYDEFFTWDRVLSENQFLKSHEKQKS